MAGTGKKRKNKATRPEKGIESFFENQRKRQHQLEQEAFGNVAWPVKSVEQKEESTDAEGRVPTESVISTENSNDQTLIDQQKNTLQETAEQQEAKSKDVLIQLSDNRFDQESASNCPLSTDPLLFEPASYAIDTWITDRGVSTPYSFLADAFSIIEGTTARTTILHVLCNMLRVILVHAPSDLLPTLWLCSNAIDAPFRGVELGIGPLVLTKALTAVSGTTSQKLRQLYNDHGDWGDVGYAVKMSVRTIVEPKPLRVRDVFSTLRTVAAIKGKGTVDAKANLVKRLLLAAKGTEVRYLLRTCVSHLRVGAVRTTVLVALARALVLTQPPSAVLSENALVRRPDDTKDKVVEKWKQAEALLKECFAQCPDWNTIVPWLLECGDVNRVFERCGLTVCVPLRPMLGQITRDITDVFSRLKDREFVCEFKYDGQRAQIHVDDRGQVKLFSRRLEDMTEKYPDIVAVLPRIRAAETTSFIMDAEIVAISEQGKILPFQILSNRGRKNVTVENISINVCVLAFDLMYLNGESLLRLSFRERRELLRKHFVRVENKFDFVASLDAAGNPEQLDAVCNFFQQSIDRGCEGIMVKVLDHPPGISEKSQMNESDSNGKISNRSRHLLATYEPDKRLESWLKVKKDYVEGIGDSLDLVPIGAWYGNGRKAGWYSPVLLACYNPDNDTLESVCKCMSGFSDKFYKEMKEFYSDRILQKPRHDYVTDHIPDVWFDATEVWEIKGADITISPLHKGAVGQVDEERGLSLRFPRFIRKREDKTVEEATTSSTLADLYFKQRQSEEQKVKQEVSPFYESTLQRL